MAEAKKAVKATLKTKKIQFCATGRRKKSIARVRLIPGGNGAIVINKKTIEEYFPQDLLKLIVKQPLALTNSAEKYDIFVNVVGGGIAGQAVVVLCASGRGRLADYPAGCAA